MNGVMYCKKVLTAGFFNRPKDNEMVLVRLAVGPLIGRYCGTRVPPEIQSSTGILSLSFHTDMAVAKDGFSARYNMTHKEVSESKCESRRLPRVLKKSKQSRIIV